MKNRDKKKILIDQEVFNLYKTQNQIKTTIKLITPNKSLRKDIQEARVKKKTV